MANRVGCGTREKGIQSNPLQVAPIKSHTTFYRPLSLSLRSLTAAAALKHANPKNRYRVGRRENWIFRLSKPHKTRQSDVRGRLFGCPFFTLSTLECVVEIFKGRREVELVHNGPFTHSSVPKQSHLITLHFYLLFNSITSLTLCFCVPPATLHSQLSSSKTPPMCVWGTEEEQERP